MKDKLKIGSIAALAAVTILLPVNNSYASQKRASDSQNTITLSRTINGIDKPAEVSFDYAITPSESNPAHVSGTPERAKITFDSTTKIEKNSAVAYTAFETEGMDFTKVGDYEFTIKEISSSDPFNYPVDESNIYRFYASTRNVTDSDGRLTGELETSIHCTLVNKSGEKQDIAAFASSTNHGKIEISNTLKGNMANVDEYFKYKVVIGTAKGNSEYSISGQDPTIVYNGESFAATTKAKDGEVAYVYLKHGQKVVIGDNGKTGEILAGTHYSIEEMDASDYTTSVIENDVKGKVIEDKIVEALPVSTSSNTMNSYLINNFSSFVNLREANVLTGVSANIAPYVVIAMLGVAGFTISRRFAKD